MDERRLQRRLKRITVVVVLVSALILLGGSFVGVALAYPMGWVMCSTLLALYYRRSPLCREQPAAALETAGE